MSIAISLFPVILFLTGLFLLDSFKLVKPSLLMLTLLWGLLSAMLAYFFNEWVKTNFLVDFEIFTRYVAPLAEEFLKSLFVIILVARRKIGFMVDAAIYGFASGAGFALAENMVYIYFIGNEPSMMLWVVRGFGTALMHGGCAAILAMLLMLFIQQQRQGVMGYLLGLITAAVIHSLFNHFLLNPYLQTVFIFMVLPLVFGIVFQKSNRTLQTWLEVEFSNEVDMLRMMRQGRFADTRAGAYLASLRQHFDAETIVDLYNYITLYMELSIKAKRNLMLRESGIDVPKETGLDARLAELSALRKQVGSTGELALRPLIRIRYRDLWKLNQIL